MNAPPRNAHAALVTQDGGATVETGEHDGFKSKNNRIRTRAQVSANAVTDAVRHVRRAKLHLGEAVFRLDEGGYRCAALEDLSADTAALVATWAGRPVPSFHNDDVPAWVAEAARDWRRANRRTY